MSSSWLAWDPSDGPATRGLRRGLNRGLGALLLATGIVCVSGTWQHPDATFRVAAALTGALLLISGLRFMLGSLVAADLVLGGVAVVVAAFTPDPTAAGGHFTGPLVFTIWLIAAVANLQQTKAWGLLVLSVPVYLLLSWLGTGTSPGDTFDMLVLNVGMCFAELGLLGALVRNARLRDELTEEATRLEIEATLRDLEQASVSSVRRVLHDEVLSALRAIAELPSDWDEQVRLAARDAVAAVRRHAAGS